MSVGPQLQLAVLWPWLLMATLQVRLGYSGLALAAAVEADRSLAQKAIIRVVPFKLEPLMLEGVFASVADVTPAEGKLLQFHPLSLCNTSEDEHTVPGFVSIVKLERPDRDLHPCLSLANKAKLAGERGARAVLFDITDDQGAADQLRKPRGLSHPVVLIWGHDAELLMGVVNNNREAHVKIEVKEMPAWDQIHRCLETVKNERKKILAYKADAEKQSKHLLKQNELERENTVALFRQLHEFLADQEKLLLFQLEELEKDIARARDECLARLSKELSSLERLIQEMEEKHQQPDIDVLKDVRNTFQRYQKKETFENPGAFPPGLKWRLWGCCEINHLLESVIKKFQANVTLDPITADTKLILSEDRRSITCQTKAQDLPEHPENVYFYSYMLGREGFTAGCHFWEVLVGSEEGWAVGVARKLVRGRVTLTPEEGIWAVGWNKGRYKAFIKDINPLLTLHGELKKIRVSLNYEGGQVAFFDAHRAALLYRFSGASFSGETLHPFFAV
ncbi:PREDICTED: tripartite motif-containing protein 7-like, partial [Gekko japonicus]|uniref:Tripartite motif-containing protein 7-like n=1 Tax=Gekko japonicus TaxID=146911 RepID=A0ABM1K5N1_GEKJA